jgi:predicted ribosomally synthesized peptide with SipW-like signal peptide
VKKILFAVMAIVAAVGLVGGAFAYFTDSATSTTNQFTAGVLSIDDALVAESPAIVITNMAPGDVTGEYTITIKNNGSMNLGWLGDWQFSGGVSGSVDLKDALYIDYAKMQFLSPGGVDWQGGTVGEGYEADGGDLFILNGKGNGPYPSFGNDLAALSSFGVVTFNNFANPANSGMLPGTVFEHMGALKPGYSYKLTVKFGFAPGAGNDYQGLGPVTAQLAVKAVQINTAALAEAGVSDVTGWMNNQISNQIE